MVQLNFEILNENQKTIGSAKLEIVPSESAVAGFDSHADRYFVRYEEQDFQRLQVCIRAEGYAPLTLSLSQLSGLRSLTLGKSGDLYLLRGSVWIPFTPRYEMAGALLKAERVAELKTVCKQLGIAFVQLRESGGILLVSLTKVDGKPFTGKEYKVLREGTWCEAVGPFFRKSGDLISFLGNELIIQFFPSCLGTQRQAFFAENNVVPTYTFSFASGLMKASLPADTDLDQLLETAKQIRKSPWVQMAEIEVYEPLYSRGRGLHDE